jgi:ATP-dependent Clp protease protease subunit
VSRPKNTCGSPTDDEYVVAQHQGPERTIFLSGVVEEHSIANAQAMLLGYAAQSATKPVYMVVSTYGGSVDEMFGLYDVIKMLPYPVHTVGIGKVQSAGVLLMAAGTKGRRLIGANASIMMHPLSGGMQGSVFELDGAMQECKRQQRLMVSALIKETGMTAQQVDKIMRAGRDYYLTPVEAVKLGIADRLVGAVS